MILKKTTHGLLLQWERKSLFLEDTDNCTYLDGLLSAVNYMKSTIGHLII